jgi:hypothetical protein
MNLFFSKKREHRRECAIRLGLPAAVLYTIVKKEYGYGSSSDGGRRTVHQQLSQSPRFALIQELMMLKPILALSKTAPDDYVMCQVTQVKV